MTPKNVALTAVIALLVVVAHDKYAKGGRS